MSRDRGIYTDVKCAVCGRSWLAWYDPATGKGEGPHPANLWCSIHRPTSITPAWVGEALARHELAATASNLPASISDAEIARRELAGGTPTREWTAATTGVAGSISPGVFLAAVMRLHEKNGDGHA